MFVRFIFVASSLVYTYGYIVGSLQAIDLVWNFTTGKQSSIKKYFNRGLSLRRMKKILWRYKIIMRADMNSTYFDASLEW